MILEVAVTIRCDACSAVTKHLVSAANELELLALHERLPKGWTRSYGTEGRGRYHKCPDARCKDTPVGDSGRLRKPY